MKKRKVMALALSCLMVLSVAACGKDGNHKEMISDIPAMAVTCDAGHIYVLARESGEEIVFPKSR